jgi:hypothetical protein
VQLLGDAGWSPKEATAAIQMHAAAARLRLAKNPEQECSWHSEEQELRLDGFCSVPVGVPAQLTSSRQLRKCWQP